MTPDPNYPGKQRDARRCPRRRNELVGARDQRRRGGGESGEAGGDRHGTARDAGGPETQCDFPVVHFDTSMPRPNRPQEYGKTSSYLRSKRILMPERIADNRPAMEVLKTFALFAATAQL
jgi:hypothetical protein